MSKPHPTNPDYEYVYYYDYEYTDSPEAGPAATTAMPPVKATRAPKPPSPTRTSIPRTPVRSNSLDDFEAARGKRRKQQQEDDDVEMTTGFPHMWSPTPFSRVTPRHRQQHPSRAPALVSPTSASRGEEYSTRGRVPGQHLRQKVSL